MTPGSNSARPARRLLDWVPGPARGEEGAVIDLHDAAGRADPVVIVPRSWVRAVAASADASQEARGLTVCYCHIASLKTSGR